MISKVLGKILKGESLDVHEGLVLYSSKDLLLLGGAAQNVLKEKCPNGKVSYIVDRNINYTNVCVSACRFCAFYTGNGAGNSYILAQEALARKIEETKALGGTQVLLQGGLHPDLKIKFYEDLVRFIRSFDIHVHGFSPPEIIHISNLSSLPVKEVLVRLIKAGLGSIPGGGAEVLVDRVRKKISPNKCSAGEWLTVMEKAHSLGLKTTATMMFGHVETLEERLVHMVKLRELQSKTGGFTAFIPWPFQPGNTRLSGKNTSAFEYLQTVAVSRLMLDNFDNIQASWVTQGGKIAQLALNFGANDMGSTMIEENVVKAAGVSNRVSEEEIRTLITTAGFQPMKRNTFYDSLEPTRKVGEREA
ncbi:MAG: cyclic dehypoxanthinyl futalosine synthase [Nitrospinota bacterium]